ncbi:MAG: primase [Candidatus Saccharibacteria bacterium]|nr:primase [Candidatus Saccharibacteria bacterium]
MDEVGEVKSRLEITEVVGAYLPLKQAGRNLKAPCPFHQEKTASFMVSPEKGIYHCFGCGEGGDIFNFVMKMEGLGFREAMELLARKAGVELKAKKGESQEVNRLRNRLLAAHELAAKYFQATLMRNASALEYVVKKRGLNRETVGAFQIGYAPDSWEALTGFMQKKGFTQRELLQGGLAGQKEGRNTIYDLFRGRIMFPISDREGRVIGFTARVLDDSLPIRSSDEVVLVEGQMDVVASHQAGVKQVVAASGTALTLEHLRALSKLTKNIKLAFDADRAGLAATERAIEMGQKLGLTLRMVEMPKGVKDADELIKQDVEAWRGAIANAKYIVDYLFDRFEQDFDLDSAVGKRGYADRLAANLRRLGDPVEQDHYVKLLAQKTGTSEEAVKAKIEKGDEVTSGADVKRTELPSDSQPARRAVIQATGKPSAREKLEESFLGLALAHPLTRVALDDVKSYHFSNPARKAVFEAMQADKAEPGEKIAAGLGDYAVYAQQLLGRKVFLMANAAIKKELGRQIKEAESVGDAAKVAELMAKFQSIIKAEA